MMVIMAMFFMNNLNLLIKFPRRVRTAVLLLFSLPLVLMIRLLKPIVLIRLGSLRTGRLGHLALNTEIYCCEVDAGIHDNSQLDIFFPGSSIANHQLVNMWKRVLFVNRFARYVDRVNGWLPGAAIHKIPLPTDRDERQLLTASDSHIAFTKTEKLKGRHALSDLGLIEGKPFVCFHARDSAYLSNVDPHVDWSYHDYRDTDISNFVPAVEELARLGYQSVRLGAVVAKPVDVKNPKIIDYAINGRNEFMDIFLASNCRFLLASSSGLMGLAQTFRVPLAYVNQIPLEYEPRGASDLFIPKKLRISQEDRFMTFREVIESGAGRFLRGSQFDDMGIEVIENTSDEVLELAKEMEQRLTGEWQETDIDQDLQRRYWGLFNGHKTLARIGSHFLRANQDLLEI